MGMWDRCNAKPALGAPIDWAHPLAGGLVMALPFNEGAGATAFDAASQLESAAFGTATTWGGGLGGPVAKTAGSSASQVTIANNAPIQFGAGPFSISMRFAIATFATANQYVIYYGLAGTNPTYFIRVNSTTVILFAVISGGTATATPAVPAMVAGQYYTIGLTRDVAGNCTAYLDGRSIATFVKAGSVTATTPLVLGGVPPGASIGTGNYMNGSIENAYAWTRGLSQSEMAAVAETPYQVFARPYQRLFRAAAAPSGAGMIHYLRRRRRTA